MGERVSIRVRNKRLEVPSAYLDVINGSPTDIGAGTNYPIGFTAQQLGHLLYGPKTYKANGFSGSAFNEGNFTSASSLSEPILELPNFESDQNRTELNLVMPNAGYPTALNDGNRPPRVYENSKVVGLSFAAPPPDITSYSQGVGVSIRLFNSYNGGTNANIIKSNNLYYPRLEISLASSIGSWSGGNEIISATSNYGAGYPSDAYGLVSVELVLYTFLGKPVTLELVKLSDNYNPEDPEAPPPFENVSLNIGSGISVDKWWTYGNSTGGPVFNDNGSAISNPFA
jgi:hypothetical protein